MQRIVLKLGGSLLTCPDLLSRLQRLLARFRMSQVLIVIGGGSAADAVRAWSRTFELSDDAAHWIALRSLATTRALVQSLTSFRETSSPLDAERQWRLANEPLLVDLETHLRDIESRGAPSLPHTWDVTSDSIAAWVAATWSADELILLKSIDLPAGLTVEEAGRRELVDLHFPQVIADVCRISWCNLLADEHSVQPWLPAQKELTGRR